MGSSQSSNNSRNHTNVNKLDNSEIDNFLKKSNVISKPLQNNILSDVESLGWNDHDKNNIVSDNSNDKNNIVSDNSNESNDLIENKKLNTYQDYYDYYLEKFSKEKTLKSDTNKEGNNVELSESLKWDNAVQHGGNNSESVDINEILNSINNMSGGGKKKNTMADIADMDDLIDTSMSLSAMEKSHVYNKLDKKTINKIIDSTSEEVSETISESLIDNKNTKISVEPINTSTSYNDYNMRTYI